MALIIPIIEPVIPDFFARQGSAITRDRPTASIIKTVYARQHGKCAFSGVVHREDRAIKNYDHLVSNSRGGYLNFETRSGDKKHQVKYWAVLGLCEECNKVKLNFDAQYFFVGEYCHVHGYTLQGFNYAARRRRYQWHWEANKKLESARPFWLVNIDGSPIYLENFDEVSHYKRMFATYVPKPRGRPRTIMEKHSRAHERDLITA